MSARDAFSSGSRLFQSYRSYSRVPRSNGAYGFVHESSLWKKGHLRNIPPALSSAEMTACFTPRRESE
jgi:hypothetical protein